MVGVKGGSRFFLQVARSSSNMIGSTIQSWTFFIVIGLREVSGPRYWDVAGAFLGAVADLTSRLFATTFTRSFKASNWNHDM